MKTLTIKSVLILLAITISLVSCKDKETTPKNHIKYDGKVYVLNYGYLDYYGAWEKSGSYNFDIEFSSIDYDEFNKIVSPVFNYIYFEMSSSSATSLVNGTYTYDALSYEPYTFDFADFELDANSENFFYSEIEGGSVVIKKIGSEYEITFNCTDQDGKKVSGFFKGPLQYSDWSEAIKNSSNKKSRRMQIK